jgi:hypothetical protein
MYFTNKLRGFNLIGLDRSSYTFTSSPTTVISVYPFTNLVKQGKILCISTSLNTAGAGTGIDGRIGLYSLNNGRDLLDGAVKVDEITVNLTSTSTFSLNAFIPEIEQLQDFALGFGINGSFTTYPVIRGNPGLLFDSVSDRRRFRIITNSYMPNSVQISDDTDTGAFSVQFCPLFLIEIK